ncbi:hypothetical protein HNR13_000985 [Leifsonia shinshuensis]|uniref:Uncharacterized protein n=1 Tax=Leifsonia shinshuensis TaxID=150026 RepID=A0A853CQX0_9MICO|nr:hypothetical protein [Leifsonia shinshuensis]
MAAALLLGGTGKRGSVLRAHPPGMQNAPGPCVFKGFRGVFVAVPVGFEL